MLAFTEECTHNADPATGEGYREANPGPISLSPVLGFYDPSSDFGESNVCSESILLPFGF